jgi:hypothetical protein
MERVRRAVAVEIENPPPEFYAMEEQYGRGAGSGRPRDPRPRRRGDEPPRRAGMRSDSLEHHGGALSAADT